MRFLNIVNNWSSRGFMGFLDLIFREWVLVILYLFYVVCKIVWYIVECYLFFLIFESNGLIYVNKF